MFDLTEEQKFEVLTPIPAHVIPEFPILELCRLHGQGVEGFTIVNPSGQYLPFK